MKMTYAKLMAKLADGMVQVNAWGSDCKWADVTFYKLNGDVQKRIVVEVTKVPAEVC